MTPFSNILLIIYYFSASVFSDCFASFLRESPSLNDVFHSPKARGRMFDPTKRNRNKYKAIEKQLLKDVNFNIRHYELNESTEIDVKNRYVGDKTMYDEGKNMNRYKRKKFKKVKFVTNMKKNFESNSKQQEGAEDKNNNKTVTQKNAIDKLERILNELISLSRLEANSSTEQVLNITGALNETAYDRSHAKNTSIYKDNSWNKSSKSNDNIYVRKYSGTNKVTNYQNKPYDVTNAINIPTKEKNKANTLKEFAKKIYYRKKTGNTFTQNKQNITDNITNLYKKIPGRSNESNYKTRESNDMLQRILNELVSVRLKLEVLTHAEKISNVVSIINETLNDSNNTSMNKGKSWNEISKLSETIYKQKTQIATGEEVESNFFKETNKKTADNFPSNKENRTNNYTEESIYDRKNAILNTAEKNARNEFTKAENEYGKKISENVFNDKEKITNEVKNGDKLIYDKNIVKNINTVAKYEINELTETVKLKEKSENIHNRNNADNISGEEKGTNKVKLDTEEKIYDRNHATNNSIDEKYKINQSREAEKNINNQSKTKIKVHITDNIYIQNNARYFNTSENYLKKQRTNQDITGNILTRNIENRTSIIIGSDRKIDNQKKAIKKFRGDDKETDINSETVKRNYNLTKNSFMVFKGNDTIKVNDTEKKIDQDNASVNLTNDKNVPKEHKQAEEKIYDLNKTKHTFTGEKNGTTQIIEIYKTVYDQNNATNISTGENRTEEKVYIQNKAERIITDKENETKVNIEDAQTYLQSSSRNTPVPENMTIGNDLSDNAVHVRKVRSVQYQTDEMNQKPMESYSKESGEMVSDIRLPQHVGILNIHTAQGYPKRYKHFPTIFKGFVNSQNNKYKEYTLNSKKRKEMESETTDEVNLKKENLWAINNKLRNILENLLNYISRDKRGSLLKQKRPSTDSSHIVQPKGNPVVLSKGDIVVNIMPVVRCGDMIHLRLPWGYCQSLQVCKPEYRIHAGDGFCDQTGQVCCSIQGINDINYTFENLLRTETSISNEKIKSFIRSCSRESRDRSKRRKDRERRKRLLKRQIKKTTNEIKKALHKQLSRSSREKRKWNKMFKEYLQHLQKEHKNDMKAIKDIHEMEMLQKDATLLNNIEHLKNVVLRHRMECSEFMLTHT